jgi:hypothetical protein
MVVQIISHPLARIEAGIGAEARLAASKKPPLPTPPTQLDKLLGLKIVIKITK